MAVKRRFANAAIFILLLILALLVLAPILVVLMNSFKGQFFISDAPFKLPTLTETADGPATFVGFKNYLSGIEKAGFLSAFGYSLFITVFSVGDRLVHHPLEGEVFRCALLPLRLQHDRPLPDGHVPDVQGRQHAPPR